MTADRTVLPVQDHQSFAHRRGGQVRVVLRVAEEKIPAEVQAHLDGSTVRVRLRCHHRQLVSPAAITRSDSGLTLELAVPSRRVAQGVWRFSLLGPELGEAVPIQARLLATRRQPVALLPGPVARTRLEEPIASPRPGAPVRQLGGRLRRRLGRLRRSLRR